MPLTALWFIRKGQNISFDKSLEEVDCNPQGWLWRLQDFNRGNICRCGGDRRRTRIRNGAWRWDWIASVSQQNLNKCVASYGWAKKVSLFRWNLLVKIVEMTIKGLEYCRNFVDKAVLGFKKIDSNFERSSTVGKMLLNSIACYREIIPKMTSQTVWQTSLLSHFKKLPQPHQPSASTTLISH